MYTLHRILIVFLCYSLLVPSWARATGTPIPPVEQSEAVVLSAAVGEVIDSQERQEYGLFPFVSGFESAVVCQRPDSSYAVRITRWAGARYCTEMLPVDPEFVGRCRGMLATPPDKRSAVKANLVAWQQTWYDDRVAAAERTAREAWKAEPPWSARRYGVESRFDQGGTYSGSGAMLGAAVGAAAGMLVGKGLQGKKVARTVYHPASGWSEAWTEEFYSYEHRHAPHVGLVLGAAAGAVVGGLAGAHADRDYCRVVPRDIRTMRAGGSTVGQWIASLCVLGPLTGLSMGWTLATPDSGRRGDSHFDGTAFLIGTVVSGILFGAGIQCGTDRHAHRELWRESLVYEPITREAVVRLLPLDPASLTVRRIARPGGRTDTRLRVELGRITF